MKFRLEIQMGNDAVQNGNDIAVVLREVADDLARFYGDEAPGKQDAKIRDINGNTVGNWCSA